MFNTTNMFWIVLAIFAAFTAAAAFFSRGKVAKTVIGLVGIAVMVLPIATSFFLAGTPKETRAKFNEETVAMMVEPTSLAEDKDKDEPVLAGEHNEKIPPVLDNRTGLTGYQKMLHALDLPGAGLPGYIEANGFHTMNGYKSYTAFYEAVKVMAQIEEENPETNFKSMVAYGRDTNEDVSIQEMVDSALSADLHIEDALGFVAKPQGEVLIGSGSVVGGDANGAGTVVAYPTEVGRSSNIVINIFSPEMVEKIADEYGVEYNAGGENKLAAATDTLTGMKTVYASEDDNRYLQQTFKMKKVGDNTVEIVTIDENGNEIDSKRVWVSEEEAARFAEGKTTKKFINAEKNIKGVTAYEVCVNINGGMTTEKEWKKTPQKPVVVVPVKKPEPKPTPEPKPEPEPEPKPEPKPEPLASKEAEELESGMPDKVKVVDPVESSMSETSDTAPITSDNSTEMSDVLAEGAEPVEEIPEGQKPPTSDEGVYNGGDNNEMGENPFNKPDSTESSVESIAPEETQESALVAPEEQPAAEEAATYAPTPSIGDDAEYVEELPIQEAPAPTAEQPIEPAEAPAPAETPAQIEPAEEAPVPAPAEAPVQVEQPEETVQDTVASAAGKAALIATGLSMNLANAAGFIIRKGA